tara:strand:- start:293 stop:565 length:273 start_codon:yes stop_codon:yes gene_type:complete
MKSFNKFITEMQNRESPFHGNITPGGGYPKNLPYIRQPSKEMDLFKSKFKLTKLSKSKDDEINGQYKDINDPKKPPEKPIDPYTIPIKKA